MNLEVLPTQLDRVDMTERLGLPRVREVLHTCDWTLSPDDEEESIGSFQDGAELDFELDAFGESDEQNGSEQDVEYMERMMSMLLSARGIPSYRCH